MHPGSAAPEVLERVAGLPPEAVEALVAWRDGPDGVPGTEDDVGFGELRDLQQAAGLDDARFRAVRDQFTVDPSIVRVESTGYAGAARRSLRVTVTRNGTTGPRYLAWSESE